MKKKNFWNADKVVSICAIIISVVTVYISFKQHYASQEQFKIAQAEKKLSAMPYLSLTFETNLAGENFGLLVANQGIGPAFIESVVIKSKKGEEEIDINDFLFREFEEEFSAFEFLTKTNIYKGRMIPAGERFYSFKIEGSKEESEILQNLIFQLSSDESIGLAIIYSSIFGDVWKLDVESNIPQKLTNYESAL